MGRYVLQARGAIRDMRHVRPEIVRPAPVAAPEPEPAAAPRYFQMTKAELIEAAVALGIDASGTRPELIGRLSHG